MFFFLSINSPLGELVDPETLPSLFFLMFNLKCKEIPEWLSKERIEKSAEVGAAYGGGHDRQGKPKTVFFNSMPAEWPD